MSIVHAWLCVTSCCTDHAAHPLRPGDGVEVRALGSQYSYITQPLYNVLSRLSNSRSWQQK